MAQLDRELKVGLHNDVWIRVQLAGELKALELIRDQATTAEQKEAASQAYDQAATELEMHNLAARSRRALAELAIQAAKERQGRPAARTFGQIART